jgi:hypothetical protein
MVDFLQIISEVLTPVITTYNHAGIFFNLLDHEGGDMFPQNTARLSTNYTALHHRRQ